jgi:hypothetical protein
MLQILSGCFSLSKAPTHLKLKSAKQNIKRVVPVLGKRGLMLKGRKNKIPVAVGAGLLLCALLGSSLLAMKMTGLLDDGLVAKNSKSIKPD